MHISKMPELQDSINKLNLAEKQLENSKKEAEKKINEVIAILKKIGWKEFLFHSKSESCDSDSYWGQDKNDWFLFKPEIEIPFKFLNAKFHHSRHGENPLNDEWDKWVKSLPEDSFYYY